MTPVVAMLLLWPFLSRGEVMTDFSGGTLDPGVNLDVPNAGLATISLDTTNNELD